MPVWNVQFQELVPTPRQRTPRPFGSRQHAKPASSSAEGKKSPFHASSSHTDINISDKLDTKMKLHLASQPLQEVANRGLIDVNVTHDPTSPTTAQLSPCTRLHLLATHELPDGTKRACIVLEGSVRPLGWATTRSARGVAYIHRYARPVYEVVSAAKVRKEEALNSRFLKQLPEGTKLHVVDAHRVPDGTSVRVRVCVLGEDAPCGWLTSIKIDGTRTIVALDMTEKERQAFMHASSRLMRTRDTMASALSAVSRVDPPHQLDSRKAQERRRLPRSSSEDALAAPARMGSLSARASSAKSTRSTRSTRSGRCQESAISYAEGLSAASVALREARARLSTESAPAVEQAIHAAAVVCATRKSSATSVVATRRSSKAGPSASAKQDTPPAAATPLAAVPQKKLSSLSYSAIEELASNCIKQRSNLSSAAEIQAEVDALLKSAKELESAMSADAQSLRVRVGDTLASKKVKVDELMREWDPNADGTISRIEFRQDIRKLLSLPAESSKEIDQLFMSLDSDKGGDIDPLELKQGMKRLQDEAAANAASAAETNARVAKICATAAMAQEVADVTQRMDDLAHAIGESASTSVAVQLANAFGKRNINATEMLKQWDKDGDGHIDENEFCKQVMLVVRTAHESDVHALFKSLDSDGGGSLDMSEVRQAIKHFQEEAESNKVLMRAVYEDAITAFRKAKVKQAEWRAKRVQDEEDARAEEDQKARVAEQKLVDAAAAKAAKKAQLEESFKKAEQDKSEFKAKVMLKRKHSLGNIVLPVGLEGDDEAAGIDHDAEQSNGR